MDTDYKLIFDGFYRWSRSGKVAEALSGCFIRKSEAARAWELYELSKKAPASSVVKSADLESLNNKADLLKWAEVNNLEVPDKHKQPSAIKKFLMGKYKD
ncbi:MAG TPA: hypothetical protein DCX01_03910 [Bacteroidetes bacterium]|jgi:hypothetical protein|nr:hypothetical protein [Bacteroidota bacterium]|tara:strand:- start:1864 stop:2163 length:300 start_codon:yes stop_codon:yes gene_type:complete